MKGIKQVYISPIGEVNKISFSAIYQNNLSTPTEIIFSDTIKSSKNNQIADESISQKYLIDRYTIRILTTTRYLADGTLIKKKEWNKRIILMGGIDYDRISRNSNCLEGQDFTKNNTTNINNNYNIEPFNRNTEFESPMPYLSGTLEEIDRIGFRLKKENWSVTSFTDSSALEHCLKTELNTYNPCIIHIATHGFSFIDIDRKDNELNINSLSSYKTSENPMSRCGLMLSGSNLSWVKNPLIMIDKTGEDGILTASEVANLDLSQTSLVVLSACNTGIGQIEDGEGIFGLNRGFKLAGVDELIVSLWEVEDFQTMELMDKFYSLLSHNQNASLSFHQAQSWMRTKYPTRPDLWAGFVFIH
jgi:CHAT domain-containing protein